MLSIRVLTVFACLAAVVVIAAAFAPWASAGKPTIEDGTEVISIVGQLPFAFIGILKINLATGEVIHEPAHDISGRIDEACAALTA